MQNISFFAKIQLLLIHYATGEGSAVKLTRNSRTLSQNLEKY
jgi:hypothetical protein